MKVTGTGGVSQATGPKPARSGGGEGFRLAAAPATAAAAQTSGVSGVMGVEALLALQDVESPTERRRRSVRRADRLLDELDEIKIALLGGELTATRLEGLSRAIREQRSVTEDAALESLVDEIETRAAVEQAKLESARRGS